MGSFQFVDEETNRHFIDKLRAKKIPFLLDGGTVFYLDKNLKQVERIACQLRDKIFPNKWQIVCFPKGWEKSYREYMDEKGILYFDEINDGELCLLVSRDQNVHEWYVKLPPAKLSKYTARKCATLGTNFRDIYCDGKLFATQVSKDVASYFIRHPEMWHGNVGASIHKFRCWMMEQEYVLAKNMESMRKKKA